MGAGLCSCHRAPPAKYRRGLKGSPTLHPRSPCYASPNELRPEDRVHRGGTQHYTLTTYYSSYKTQKRAPPPPYAASVDSNIALLEETEDSLLYQESSECSSLRSSNVVLDCEEEEEEGDDRRPLLLRDGGHPDVMHSPTLVSRSKPPPKPPRLLQGYTNRNSACSPTPSTGSESLKASLADVTNTLDLSIASNDTTATLPERGNNHAWLGHNKAFRSKVHHIMAQARDFLVCELDPEAILPYLVEKEAVSDCRAQEMVDQSMSKLELAEHIMDAVTQQGPREFKVFCDGLRYVQKENYLADLLHVLDCLIETMAVATATILKSDPGYDSMEAHLNTNSAPSTTPCLQCSTCMSNNEDELLGESPTFDIEMSYLDIVTGDTKPLHNVNTIKIDRPLTPRGFDKSFSFNEEDADRYIPVISISLFHQCLSKESLETIGRLLQRYTCIRELTISKCHLVDCWTTILGKAIARNRSLSKLDIRFNALDESGVKMLAEGLAANVNLKFINLAGTELSGPGCANLLHGLSVMPLLIELDVGFNDLQDVGCKAVASMLARNPNLKRLRMRDNCISWYGCNALFKALKRNFRLTVLDLSSNKIGNSCLAYLAEMLLSNRTLREMNLENCGISEEGCIALARALKTNSTLKVLDLSMNPMLNVGIKGLADGIKYNHVLETLCLNMCKIGNQGFLEILEALRYNTNMTTLKLCYNDIGRGGTSESTTTTPCEEPAHCEDDPPIDVVYEHLCQILQFNKNLKVLLWGNRLDGPGDTNQE